MNALEKLSKEEFVKDNIVDLDKVQASVKELLDNGQKSLNTMNTLAQWDSVGEVVENIKTINEFLVQVVSAVEAVVLSIDNYKELVSSEDKLNIAVQLVDDAIKLPWYLESVDGIVLKMLISSTVTFINKSDGKAWDLNKILGYLDKGKALLS